MALTETYSRIRKSIVAIVRKYEPLKIGDARPEIPFILGTGFIVDDGLIATNDHIVKMIDSQPKPDSSPKEEWPVLCLMFIEMNENDYAILPLNVLGKMVITSYDPKGVWYGDKSPDLGFIRVKAKGLPILPLNTDWSILKEGMELATSGFPMGRETLTAPGYLHHFGPTLQTGILSALLPFPRSRPHGFILNVVSQGGQSGSPIFKPDTGEVLGILYAGLKEPAQTKVMKGIYLQPTAITYGLPSGLIQAGIEEAHKLPNYALPDDTLTIQQMIESYPREVSEGANYKSGESNINQNAITILNKKD